MSLSTGGCRCLRPRRSSSSRSQHPDGLSTIDCLPTSLSRREDSGALVGVEVVEACPIEEGLPLENGSILHTLVGGAGSAGLPQLHGEADDEVATGFEGLLQATEDVDDVG